jgi:hypothetical protein
VTVSDPFGAAGSTPYKLGVYNSACRTDCTGNDDDLATGSGITNPPINAVEDTPAEDYILITPQGSDSEFGDRVSKALFTFSFDMPSLVKNLVLIDMDENNVPNIVSMIFNFSDGTMGSFFANKATSVLNAGENNAYSFFDIENDADLMGFYKPVNSFAIQYGTNTSGTISGGIAGFAFTPAPIPVPAALPLLAGALGMLG